MNPEIDLGRAFLVIVITLVGVVVINAMIYLSLKGNRTHHQIDLLRKASERVRNPWEQEDSELSELSKLVKELKNHQSDPGKEDR